MRRSTLRSTADKGNAAAYRGGVDGEEDTGYSLHFPDIPKLELDELIDQLVERAQGVKRAQGRLRGLLRAIQSVTGDLSLERVLRRIVEAACELAGARYAALGVVGPDDKLEQFIYVGIDDDTARAICHLPEGKGLLGALISDPQVIRLQHMSEDPRSVGFPAQHPPMDSFLGVPVRVRGEIFGNLYLTDSSRGAFSSEDEELVTALALAAGTAVSNARLYQESQRQQRWLEASAEVQAQLLTATGEEPLHTIARRAIDLADADLVTVALIDPADHTVMVEFAAGDNAEELRGRRFPITQTLAGDVVASDEPILLSDVLLDGPQPLAHLATIMEAGPIIVVPLRGTQRSRGVLSLVRRRGREVFTQADLRMAAGFAAHASVALELADAREAERRMIMLEERDRIARDLHDHVIQELFSIGLGLQGVAGQLEGSPELARRIVRRVDDIDRAIRRIRTSIFALRGGMADGTSQSLRTQILQIASDVTPMLGFPPAVSFAGLIDTAVEPALAEDVAACVREALTNIGRHAAASAASVEIDLAKGQLTVRVADDGVGMPERPTRSSGLANLQARAEKHAGSFVACRRDGGGTVLEWKASIS
jgi:signal transduction histidine kinase